MNMFSYYTDISYLSDIIVIDDTGSTYILVTQLLVFSCGYVMS